MDIIRIESSKKGLIRPLKWSLHASNYSPIIQRDYQTEELSQAIMILVP